MDEWCGFDFLGADPVVAHSAVKPSWWTSPAWAGGYPRWQVSLAGAGGVLGLGAILFALLGRKSA